MRRFGRILLAATLFPAICVQASPLTFAPSEISDWEARSFAGETRYEAVQRDGRSALHAVCDEATSSGLFRRKEVDLARTPVLEWSWRVDDTFGDIDETTKAGDDYPARIYVVDEHPIFPWRTRALSYVWSSSMPEGADWANAYAKQVRMIAVDSGREGLEAWHSYRRNLREDFRRYHGRDIETIDAIAIMSDCDNTGKTSEAWFGEIRLRKD